jgi:IS30 family transposase
MVSHINSQPKENLKGKSPLEMMEFLSPDLYKKFIDFGIKKTENDEIILKPYLLKEDN